LLRGVVEGRVAAVGVPATVSRSRR
jgi:hypothetical protein